jgi:peroxiredoxin
VRVTTVYNQKLIHMNQSYLNQNTDLHDQNQQAGPIRPMKVKFVLTKWMFYLLVVSILFSCTSKPHYTIKGQIEGSDSMTFYLQKRAGSKTVSIDSAVSKKGIFTMKGGAIKYPQMVFLVAGNGKKRTSFYLENTDIQVKGKIDSLYKAEITGSKTQDEYNSLIKANRRISEVYSKIVIKHQAASQAGDTATIARLENQLDSIETQMKNLQLSFVKDHPKSYATPYILSSLTYSLPVEETEKMVNALDTSLASLPEIKSLKDRLVGMKAVNIGQKAPDFTLNDVNGKPVSLSSKIGSKLLLIDFWAGWCGPCREENPNVVKIYNEFHKKGFDIVGVSLDHEKDTWMKAIKDDKLAWTQISDLQWWDNAAAKLYSVRAIPANFLLNESGIIIDRNLRGKELYNKVNQVLGTKK